MEQDQDDRDYCECFSEAASAEGPCTCCQPRSRVPDRDCPEPGTPRRRLGCELVKLRFIAEMSLYPEGTYNAAVEALHELRGIALLYPDVIIMPKLRFIAEGVTEGAWRWSLDLEDTQAWLDECAALGFNEAVISTKTQQSHDALLPLLEKTGHWLKIPCKSNIQTDYPWVLESAETWESRRTDHALTLYCDPHYPADFLLPDHTFDGFSDHTYWPKYLHVPALMMLLSCNTTWFERHYWPSQDRLWGYTRDRGVILNTEDFSTYVGALFHAAALARRRP